MGTTILGTQVPIQRYYDQSIDIFVDAVFHQDYRHVWMTNFPSTLYAYPRKGGNRQDDGTCYYGRHHSWGNARDEWPDLCFQYLPDYDQKPKIKPDQLLTPEGWLVIDLYRKPIYEFRMPLALSSKTESFLLEAILRDNYDLGISVQDLRARMPGDQRNDGIRSATLSMQMSRWRTTAGCISWAPGKTASDAMRYYLDALLPQECLDANSTRGFRDLLPFEVQEMSLLNVGKFPQKARMQNKDFSDKHKQKKFAEALKKYKKLRVAHDGRDELTETYHKALDIRAEREGRQDEDAEIEDFVSIDQDKSDDSDSDEEKEYVPIHETNQTVVNTQPRRDARHAAALQNPDLVSEYSSDDDEDYGSVPEENPCFHRNERLHNERKAARKAARENKNVQLQTQSWAQTLNPRKNKEPSIDFRTLVPSTMEQIELIQFFLIPTRNHFRLLTGNLWPEFELNESYMAQWWQLQLALDQWMRSFCPEGEGIQLIGLLELTDLSCRWNDEWDEEILGESVDMAWAQNAAFLIMFEMGLFRT